MGGMLSRPGMTSVHDVDRRQSKLYSAQDKLVEQLMDLDTDATGATGLYQGNNVIAKDTGRQQSMFLVEERVAALHVRPVEYTYPFENLVFEGGAEDTGRQESMFLVEERVAALHVRPGEYTYPFENLVFEGGGVKGTAYCGAVKVLEEVGIMPGVRRLAGSSAGALVASLLAVGCTAHEMEDLLKTNFRSMLLENSYLWFIPNLWRLFGWSSFDTFINWIGTIFEQKTGNKDITFAELYKRTGKELCIVVTNVNQMHAEYFHPKTTPDSPIRQALRMSMTIPGLFQPVKYQSYGHDNIYVDGGVLCNYPIHCFDGWWLSMQLEDRFLSRMQPLQKTFVDKDRFGRFNNKTLGFKVYSEYEDEVDRILLEETTPMSDSPVIPDTILSRKTLKETKIRQKALEHHLHITNAVNAFIKVLGKYNVTKQVYISKDELQQALSDEDEFPKRYAERLFGANISLDEVFDMLDQDGNGKIQLDELIYFIERTGVGIAARYFGYKWREVTDIWSFIYTLHTALVLNLMKNSFLAKDIERSVGINTGYIQTTDFDLEHEDIEFLKKQGQRYTEAFLKHYVVKHGLQKNNDTGSGSLAPETEVLPQQESANSTVTV